MTRLTPLPLALFPLALSVAVLTFGCADYAIVASEDAARGYYDTGGALGAEASDTEGGDNDDGLGSEQEDDFLKLAPAVTDAYVFVANTTRGTVTRIAVPELTVVTVDVGTDPTVVTTTSDYSRAVVFNQGSDDISIIDAETLTVQTVAVRHNLNPLTASKARRRPPASTLPPTLPPCLPSKK
jgi:YVTN family beta-propeller protein